MCELIVGAWLAEPERHPQRVEHERVAHVGGQLPADDDPAEHVDHEAEVDDSLPAAQVGEIPHQQAVRRLGAVKSRLTRSGRPIASPSRLVVRHGFRDAWRAGSRARPSVAAPGSAAPARPL
jgi:hypothetical protein